MAMPPATRAARPATTIWERMAIRTSIRAAYSAVHISRLFQRHKKSIKSRQSSRLARGREPRLHARKQPRLFRGILDGRPKNVPALPGGEPALRRPALGGCGLG